MRTPKFTLLFALICVIVITSSAFLYQHSPVKSFKFPYKAAGLTERQAAEHLLDRFTYGATPGQIDAVVKMGLENWFQQQLNAGLPDDTLNQKLGKYQALTLSNAQLGTQYPPPGALLYMAVKDGVISKDSISGVGISAASKVKVLAYMQRKGLKIQFSLFQQFIDQKILRSAYSNNQLQEVLTEFWFNHFNVSITKEVCAAYIPDYERDVIRPNVLGKFDNLLLATAKSPAMLYYLDNATSAGPATNNAADAKGMEFLANNIASKTDTNYQKNKVMQQLQQNRKNQGLNENYARELMELHTLGVDGGYSQNDVTQAAKVLTGWTVFPIDDGGYNSAILKYINKIGENNLSKVGFVHDGDFFFAMNRHDKSEKTVLGKTFPANGGYKEGVDLIEMLAHHPSTAKFICHKLAVRFVSDDPPATLINKMVQTFTEQDGDIKQVLITLVTSPEFWNAQALRQKTKSPFELAISSVRNLNADVTNPYPLATWIEKMGQKIYYYAAPTGFPDKGQYWINTGALLNRMNFGLALTANRIPGVTVNLAALNNNHEPESAEAALLTYSKLIMPERNQDLKALKAMLADPELMDKVDKAASKNSLTKPGDMPVSDVNMMDNSMEQKAKANMGLKNNNQTSPMLSQAVGIIIGSPEYQRR
jgi:uncharacterized protein (DUF1800 family)